MASGASATAPPIRRRLTQEVSEPLLRSAYSLMLNVGMNAVLGFGFWIAAARLFPSTVVGRDSALISAMITLSTICQLNLGPVMLRFLPIVKMRPGRVVIGAYLATGLLAALGGCLFVALATQMSHNYRFLDESPSIAVAFVLATTVWGVFALQDAVLTAWRKAPWIPVENSAFGTMKVLALPLLLALGVEHAVFIAWAVPMAILVIPVNYLIFARVIPHARPMTRERSPVERFGWSRLRRYFAQDYVASIFTQAASTLIPVLIVALIGTRQNAYFYIPFTIVTTFDLVFTNASSSLTVEAAMAESRLPSLARLVTRRFSPVLIGGVVLLAAGATVVLSPFGPGYARAGAPVLRLLVCASVFRAIVALFGAVCRIEGRAGDILALQGALFAMVIALTVVLAQAQGIVGVGYAWLAANLVAGAIAAPRVLRVLRSHDLRATRDQVARVGGEA